MLAVVQVMLLIVQLLIQVFIFQEVQVAVVTAAGKLMITQETKEQDQEQQIVVVAVAEADQVTVVMAVQVL